ncbi:MAG: VanW family protein, partial [Tetrasphaera sp.]|nr:VanW family protein [Tetrasphaera sp.]
TFTTHFPYAPDRTHNITLAAKRLNGAYVAPGETFSLNAWLGQRTPEKGYRGAPVIYNGRLTKDYGGGISQVSTTLFNAIFFSGAQIDQYTPHSFYISRYPEGREATISWPNVDNRFTNTTKGGILIQASVGPDSITVTFKGKKT